MIKYSLVALSVSTIFAVSFPVHAQKSPTASPEKSIASSSDKFENPVVGSVNGVPIYWGQVLDRMKRQNPDSIKTNVAQAVGANISEKLFGKANQTSVVVTKNQALNALRENPTQEVQQAVATLIQLGVVEQEAKKQGVKATDADVNGYLTKLLKNLRTGGQIPAEQTDAQFLATRGLSKEKATYLLRLQYLANELNTKQIDKDLGHPMGNADFVQARHILIKVDAPAPDAKPEDTKKADEAALAKIKSIAADIKANKVTFEDAAKQSDDPGSKDKGGDLGVFTHGMMVPEFDKAAFTLKPNEISEPIRTQYGYHIIQVTKLGKDLPATEVTQQQEAYRTRKLNEYMTGLMGRYKTENKLQKATPMSGGMPMPPGGGGRPPMPRPNGVRPPVPTPPQN